MLKKILLVSSILLATACSTTGGSSGSGKPGEAKLDFEQQPIVLQTSGKTLMKQISRDRWINVRNSTKNEHVKLYANLGAAEWDVAIADARNYLQNHPQDEVALTALALALTMKQNYSLAGYYAKLLDKYHPGNPEVKNILGLAEMSKPGATFQDYKEAIRFFESAFNTSQSQIASGMNLAQLHLEMGNFESSRDVYQAVYSRCGKCSEAGLGYGIALARLQSFSKADEAFNDVLDHDKNNPYARYYLALIAKYGRNDNDEAMKQLQAMLDDTEGKNLEMQRKANFLLRRIQAQVYGKPKDKVQAYKPAPKKPKPLSDVKNEDIETVIDSN
jgi:cytochrome c-type biogenesis protein CcmH/NrfG